MPRTPKPTATPKAPRATPLIKIVSDGGGFGLSEQAFVQWWRHLPLEDQETFKMLGGDEMLARFVCAYDYVSSDEGENPATVARAFAIAEGLNQESNEVHRRANAAWDHPAVRELLDRMLARETGRAARRVERKFSYLVEHAIDKALETDSLDEVSKVINATARYLGYTVADRKEIREIRARLENEALKKAITQQGSEDNTDRPITEEDLPAFKRMLEHRFGKEHVRTLMLTD